MNIQNFAMLALLDSMTDWAAAAYICRTLVPVCRQIESKPGAPLDVFLMIGVIRRSIRQSDADHILARATEIDPSVRDRSMDNEEMADLFERLADEFDRDAD